VVLVILILFVSLSITCLAGSPGDVVINEIAWMGTVASTSDEWIELYNTTDLAIDIEGWSIYGADTGQCINFSNADGHTTWSIPAQGYLIYANDEHDVNDAGGISIVDIWDATIGMNNTSPGQIVLYDGPDCTGNVIDTANQSTGDWYAGEASPGYITMERHSRTISGTEQSNWATNDPVIARSGLDANSDPINGTPKARNSATNTDPIADAGVDQWVIVGDTTYLDGAGSSDPDGDPLDYEWKLVSRPSGSSASLSATTSIDPSFSVDLPGTYVVTLSVADTYRGTDGDQVVVVAQAPPQAAFTGDPQLPTVWDTVRFTDLSTDIDGTITAWAWTFGDGAVSVDQSPTHGYWYPGTYSVVLKVTDDDGLSDSMTRGITVALGPGDLDSDGVITVLDVRLCLQIATGVITGSLDQRAAADVDADGDVDLADAQILADYIIGIRSPLVGGG